MRNRCPTTWIAGRSTRRLALALATTGVAAALAAPAAGAAGLVAFTEGSTGLYTVPASGGTPKAINSAASLPAWSPNGKQLAYVANGAIYVVNANGTGRKRIAARAASTGLTPDGGPPAWSPNGKQIAFAANGSVYVVKPTGGKVKRIMRAGATKTQTSIGLSPTVNRASHAAWSSNGLNVYILAASTNSPTAQLFDLYAVPASGRAPSFVGGLGVAGQWLTTPYSLDIQGIHGVVTVVAGDSAGVASTPTTTGLQLFTTSNGAPPSPVISGFSAGSFAGNGRSLCATAADGSLAILSSSGTVVTANVVPAALKPSECAMQ